jgi:hypothetical protein
MLVHRFSSYLSFIIEPFTTITLQPQGNRYGTKMASFKSNASYDTLISLHGKLMHLNGVIIPEAINRFKDELGRIFTVAKRHHYKQA